MAGSEPLAEPLGLAVLSGRGGDAPLQDPVDQEVDRPDVGKRVPLDLQPGRFREQFPEPSNEDFTGYRRPSRGL